MTSPPDKIYPMTPPDDLGAWMAQYGPALRRYFTRKIGPAQADDLVQEVFLHLQARVGRANAENVESYLFAVARNVLIDRIRADYSRRALHHRTLDEATDAADDISPERILAAKQEYSRVLDAIVALPPRMKMAFVLHRFHRLSFSAIAKRMHITKPGVQTLVRGAMERMMKNLEDRP